jgi:uncharacterized RmlC-like cupin family protein
MTLPVLQHDKNGNAVQVLSPSISTAVTTSGAGSASGALPTGSVIVRLETTGPAWIRFGDSTVTAVSNGTSVLMQAGDYFRVPQGATHLAVLRIGSENVSVSITRMD